MPCSLLVFWARTSPAEPKPPVSPNIHHHIADWSSKTVWKIKLLKKSLRFEYWSYISRKVESCGSGWFWESVEVWRRRWETKGSPEYQPLTVSFRRCDPGSKGPPDSRTLQELTTHVPTAGLAGKRQQNRHGCAGRKFHHNFNNQCDVNNNIHTESIYIFSVSVHASGFFSRE